MFLEERMIKKSLYFMFFLAFAVSLFAFNGMNEASATNDLSPVNVRGEFCKRMNSECHTRCHRRFSRPSQSYLRNQCKNLCNQKFRRCLKTGRYQ